MTESLQERQETTIRTETEPERKTIEIREGIDGRQWNAYLSDRHGGSLFHRNEWEHVYAAYGLKLIRLAALREERVVGVLPLVWQRSLAFGNQLVSLPWFDAAGVLADDSEARDALIDRAGQLAGSNGGSVLQLRQTDAVDASPHVRTDKVLMRLRLPADPDELWKGFKATVRNQVRKAEKSGLTVERDGTSALVDFYSVYSQNMRDLGSPPHHRTLFERVLQAFADESSVYTVRLDDRAVGAGLTMANGSRLEIPWASSLREFNGYCVNHLMYWRILEDACREGFQWFHFGRSTRDSGPYRFKKQWGAEPLQLYWYYASDDERKAQSLMSPEESFGWGQRLWQRLPVPLARLIGPYIISRVP